jgi:hypothetical protein
MYNLEKGEFLTFLFLRLLIRLLLLRSLAVKRGGDEDVAEMSYSTDSISAKTHESWSKANRRLKSRVKQVKLDSVSSTIPIPLDSKPVAVKSSHSNRKVILVSQPAPDNSRARRHTNRGRESKMPARFLVTLDALQEGGGNDVTAQ